MIPYVRDIDIEYGRCDQVSPLIRRVTANNPGPFTYLGTGTYIVGKGQVAVIDPGPDDPAHLEAILAAIPGETVSHILITHNHADHSPLAMPLKARTGAPIYGCLEPAEPQDDGGVKMDAGRDRSFVPDVSLCEGGVIEGAGWTMDAINTPGHTSNHVCFGLREENACFSGDHIMGWSTTVITPPDGDMTAYLASLDDIRRRAFDVLWPTHGPPIREVDAFIGAYIDHRQERVDQILNALRSGPARINDLVPRLYADVDSRLHPAAARSMQAAMIHLVRRGELTTDGDPGPASTYRLAQ